MPDSLHERARKVCPKRGLIGRVEHPSDCDACASIIKGLRTLAGDIIQDAWLISQDESSVSVVGTRIYGLHEWYGSNSDAAQRADPA